MDDGLEILEVLKPNWSEILCPDAQLHSFLPMMIVNHSPGLLVTKQITKS